MVDVPVEDDFIVRLRNNYTVRIAVHIWYMEIFLPMTQ